MPIPFNCAFAAPLAAALSTGNYDRIAWFYDALAGLIFGRSLRLAQQAALLAGLPPGAPRVLILGGGTGWVLAEVLRLRPDAQVLYLEASAQMLSRARRHQPAFDQNAQVEFRHGTEQDLHPGEQFDAIITFFVLDCFTAALLPGALQQLDAVRHPAAPWLLVDFRLPRNWRQQGLLWTMYLFFRLTTGLQARTLLDLPAALMALSLRAHPAGTFFGGTIEAIVFEPANATHSVAANPESG